MEFDSARREPMDLILKVIEGPGGAEWRGLQARFDASGGLIGRAETARLSLPDSSRTVSRFHAHVSCSDDTYYLEEMGSRNAATINGKALKAGSKEALRPGDKVQIGHFTLAVDFDDPDFPATEILDRRSLRIESGEDDDSTRIALRARPSNSSGELLQAFQHGAGTQIEMLAGLQPEFMRTLGLMLRVLIGGIHRLSSQRMRLREEPAANRADPAARHIDPIRAAAEDTRVLSALLKPGGTGSDPPHTRVQEMVDELAARIAAMRAAVDAAVEQTEARLAPSAVEARLKASLFLDELLPMRRKARLWDLYRRSHASTADRRSEGKSDGGSGGDRGSDTASGVRELFNLAFTRAYEAEVARLRKSRQ
jgi:predicted component of type VI protein secretion system